MPYPAYPMMMPANPMIPPPPRARTYRKCDMIYVAYIAICLMFGLMVLSDFCNEGIKYYGNIGGDVFDSCEDLLYYQWIVPHGSVSLMTVSTPNSTETIQRMGKSCGDMKGYADLNRRGPKRGGGHSRTPVPRQKRLWARRVPPAALFDATY